MVQWIFSGLTSIIFIIPGVLLGLAHHRLGQFTFRLWGRLQRKIFGLQVDVVDENEGQYNHAPYVYTLLNQTSLSEIIIWPPEIPTDFYVLMNIEFAFLPVPGWIMAATGHPVVVRQWKWQAARIGKKIVRILKSGRNLAIAIEGKRSKTGELAQYRKGAVVAAIESQATIIPLTIKGAERVMPYGSWRLRAGKVELKFHKSISTVRMSYGDRDKLLDQLRSIARVELNK